MGGGGEIWLFFVLNKRNYLNIVLLFEDTIS